MPKTTNTRPLACVRCRNDGATPRLTVDRGQVKRTRHGKRITHVHVTCSRGHEWWSTSREALAIAKAADDAAKAQAA